MISQLTAFDRRRGVGQPTALYRLYGAADVLLYVGITKNTGQRCAARAGDQRRCGQRLR